MHYFVYFCRITPVSAASEQPAEQLTNKLKMSSHIMRFTAVFIFLLYACTGATATDTRAAVTDSLLGQLSIAANAHDSISPLYSMFDMSYGPARKKIAHQLYLTAKQAQDDRTCLDMLRHIANLEWKDDSVLTYVKSEIAGIDDSPEKKSTKLFVDMIGIDNLLYNEQNQDDNELLLDYVRRFSSEPASDGYEKTLLLYAVCRYLGKETRGELLEKYIDRLYDQIESMNLPDGAVRRLVYNRAAPIFFENENYRRVMETDMRMLHELDSLEVSYEESGRNYYNAPVYRYSVYRRMLGCYPILSKDEVESLYGKTLLLADLNPNIAYDLGNNERANIYYAMSTGDYQRAKTMLKRQINAPIHASIRLSLLKMLKEAALKTDDTETLLATSLMLDDEFDKRLERKRQERSRELRLVYDLNDLLERNSQLQADSHRVALRARSALLAIGLCAIVILTILTIMLFRQNRRKRKLATRLSRSNDSLRKERDELKEARDELAVLRDQARAADRRKTEFINNMSHEVKVPLAAISEYAQLIADCIPESQHAYLDRFASIINLNVRLVMRLVNDVLDTDSLENGQMSLEIRPTSVNSICRLAIDSVFECGRPDKEGLDFVFRPESGDDIMIDTDGQRVGQVLTNMLTNAVKFSDDGTINLSYHLDEEKNLITFTVTDEGQGIPDGQEEAIFDRFRRLDHTVSGCGLGLYISRLIAGLLKGTLKVDPTYKGGAKFVFTIPTKA